jgi:hypothetical protein
VGLAHVHTPLCTHRMDHAYFVKVEAEEKIGKRIVTPVPWPLVPAWTQGIVVGIVAAYTIGSETYCGVLIAWDPPASQPLVDGFSRLDYRRFLVEVEDGRGRRDRAAAAQ